MFYAVTTENLTKRYGDRIVVDDLSLRIPEGCVYGFLGPNGAGKSTTMKMLLSLIEPSDGEVQILGKSMTRATRRSLLGRIGSLIEAPPGYAHLTGAENMRLIQRLLHLDDAQIEHAVQVVHLTEQMNKKVREYSLGMKQRLGIAMALAQETDILLLDEPTTFLDVSHQVEVLDLLTDLNASRGTTIVMVLHDLNLAARYADVLVAMQGGRIRAVGAPGEVVTPELVREVFGLESLVAPDPVSGEPMVMPIGRHHVLAR